jgi:hypothetical protein
MKLVVIIKYSLIIGLIYALFHIIIFSRFITESSYARTNDNVSNITMLLEDSLSYFPLHVGNRWYYLRTGWAFPYTFSYYVINEVIGDKIIEGKRYYIVIGYHLGHPDLGEEDRFFRIDSTTANVYELINTTEVLAESLKCKIGDTFGYYTCNDIKQEEVLGIQTTVKRFSSSWYSFYTLARGIGLIYKIVDATYYPSEWELVYAIIDGKEYGTPVGLKEDDALIKPQNYILYQNYPNPFNPSTTIEFTLPKSEFVKLKVYNILGKEVATLVLNKLNKGNHTYQFDGKNLASGIYYYQWVAGEYREVKKMILIK